MKRILLALALIIGMLLVASCTGRLTQTPTNQIKDTLNNYYEGLNDFSYNEVYSQESLFLQQASGGVLQQELAGLESEGFTCQVVSITNIVTGESLGSNVNSGSIFATATVILKTNDGVETETPTLVSQDGTWKIYSDPLVGW